LLIIPTGPNYSTGDSKARTQSPNGIGHTATRHRLHGQWIIRGREDMGSQLTQYVLKLFNRNLNRIYIYTHTQKKIYHYTQQQQQQLYPSYAIRKRIRSFSFI